MNKAYFIIAMLFVLSGCSEKEKESEYSQPEPRITNVKTTTVESFSGSTSFEYSGLVEAKEVTPLSFKTPGTIVKVLAEEGQFVKEGTLLATLDDINSISAYELAKQSQQQAQDAYDRMKPMKENGTLPEIQWIEVETGLNQAIISTEMAQRRISDNQLVAPKSGVIGNKNILPGMNVMPSVTAFDIMDINQVYVNIPVPEKEIGQLKIGQEAQINIAATSQNIKGVIKRIGVAANAITHTYPVKVIIDNKGWKIKPGMVCSVAISSTETESGLRIPSKALQQNPQGEQFVYLIQGDKVHSQLVSVEKLHHKDAVIQGLNDGDQVVISGQDKLRDGAKINIINKK